MRFARAQVSNGTGITNTQTGSARNETATLDLIANLVFAESKSVRTSQLFWRHLMCLLPLRLHQVFCMIVIGLRNGATQSLKLRMHSKMFYWRGTFADSFRKFCVSSIHPAETFPLILAIGIVIQGLAFAGIQGTGLKSLFTKGCDVIAQFMWPGEMV